MSRRRRPLEILAALVAAAAFAGCVTQSQVLAMPTLDDLEPTSPAGRKCYDRCSHAQAACKHMCPKSEGLCQEDCVTDTKFCLRDCPDLKNHNPDKAWM